MRIPQETSYKQELNRKLLEWAGFRLEATGVNREIPVWIEPAGKIPSTPMEYYFGGVNYGLPDLTQSLDTCFKWLVPAWNREARPLNDWIENIIFCFMAGTLHRCQIQRFDYDGEDTWADAESPALALCLAFEKLIGGA